MKRLREYWLWLRSALEDPKRFASPPDEANLFMMNTYLLFWVPFFVLLISALNSWFKGNITPEVIQTANQRFAKPDYIISFSNNLILISTLAVPTALSYLAYLYRKPTRKYYALPSSAILLLFWSLFSSLLAGMTVFYIDVDPVTSQPLPQEGAGVVAYSLCLNSVTSFAFAYIYLGISAYFTQVVGRRNVALTDLENQDSSKFASTPSSDTSQE